MLFATGDLEAVRAAFELSDCKKVIEQQQAALLASRSRTGRGEIYRLSAICYFRLGQKSLANTQARASLRLAPVTGLDPFLSPPKERVWFETLVKEVPPPKPQVVERVVTVTATERRQRCFVPLGYCHWRFGDYGRGAGFAVAEGLGLTMNIFGYWMAREQVGTDGLVPLDRAAAMQGWTAVQFLGALIAGTALVGDLWLAREERVDALPRSR
jgi:hypothetical protein